MSKKPAIQSLGIQNLLSFGERGAKVELGPLNVLIGPNGSGKSNFLEVIGLLKAVPGDFADAVSNTGGISDCLWKGQKNPVASLEIIANPRRTNTPLRYSLSFMKRGGKLAITDEFLETAVLPKNATTHRTFLKYLEGEPIVYSNGTKEAIPEEEQDAQQSVLAQRKDPTRFPEITFLGRLLASFRLYQDWEFGQSSKMRDLYGAELKNDFLEEDIANFGIMLNRFISNPDVRPELLRYLKLFYEDAVNVATPIQGGLVDIRLEEKNRISIPATRMSDGTLRWLALLTILLHPTPPPLVCLEEPELGLHPDIIRPLGELLIEASKRMQLIVTTHSDALVDHLTDMPESVIICEKEDGSTTLRRLDRGKLSSWLERYRLGELWRTGEIGGNRW
jgi:predicted ATPase